MIEIKNVSKKYNFKDKVLDNINLNIQDGEIFGFLGPNGAGKTTLIKMITGILEIEEGKILIDKKDIKKNSIEAKEKLGLVPDNSDIFLNLKGLEYLNLMADIYNVSAKDRKVRIEKYAKIFEMTDSLNQKIQKYSHGMRQKITIIGVLLHEPKNLILDEPITGLDPKAIYDLKQIIIEHSGKQNVVFFSTHIIEIAERMCDRVAIINKGKILFVGTIEELRKEIKEKKTLEEMFMELINND